jgi:hypothetical protein
VLQQRCLHPALHCRTGQLSRCLRLSPILCWLLPHTTRDHVPCPCCCCAQAAEESRQLLSAEQAKTLKLEAQLAELNERLGGLGELERELARYRKLEKDSAAAAAQKGSGGLWGYISGQS